MARTVQHLGDAYVHLFTYHYANEARLRIPTFLHLPSGIELNLIFGGVFNMGLSQPEEDYLLAGAEAEEFYTDVHEMKPVHQVRVEPFLISRYPCTKGFAQSHCDLHEENTLSSLQQPANTDAIQLTRQNAIELAVKFGFSLPSEAQWEYACRGNTQTPFYFGKSLPDYNVLEQEILLCDFSDPQRCLKAANPYGLVGLHVGEWCQDTYTADYQNADGTDIPITIGWPFVVRGGAALAWPWQACGEWQYCMSANRSRSDIFRDFVEDELWSMRFVKRLNV